MKVLIEKASDWNYKKLKEFDSLETALTTLHKELEEDAFIVDFAVDKVDVKITVYDDWVE